MHVAGLQSLTNEGNTSVRRERGEESDKDMPPLTLLVFIEGGGQMERLGLRACIPL
jgi:hypothetical protein